MADHTEFVALGIAESGAVEVRANLGAQCRRALAMAADRQCDPVGAIHDRPVVGEGAAPVMLVDTDIDAGAWAGLAIAIQGRLPAVQIPPLRRRTAL